MQKARIIFIAICWVIVSLSVIFVSIPIALLVSVIGLLLELAHVHFVADFAGCILDVMIVFLKYITKKLHDLIHEAEAIKKSEEKKQ